MAVLVDVALNSFHWMETYGDPGFHYHQTLVKIWGLMALRLADNPILPIYPGDYADALADYAGRISSYGAKGVRREFPVLNEAISKLSKVASRFERRRAHLERKVQSYLDRNETLPERLAKHVAKTNKRLTYFERGFVDPEGIKNRTWFKHVVYAPGLWTGYASQVFPAIVDALDAKDEELLKHTEKRAALSIDNAAGWLVAK